MEGQVAELNHRVYDLIEEKGNLPSQAQVENLKEEREELRSEIRNKEQMIVHHEAEMANLRKQIESDMDSIASLQATFE